MLSLPTWMAAYTLKCWITMAVVATEVNCGV